VASVVSASVASRGGRYNSSMRSAVVTAVIMVLAAGPASAAYDRDGPYLDYSTMYALGVHGKLPRAEYPFGTYYTPVTVAQYGLQAAGNHVLTGRAAYRSDVLLAADWLVRHQRRDGGWRYWFPFTVSGFPALKPGWVSAMAQGQAMSLLWRAHALRPRQAYRRAAVRALGPFRRSTAAGGVVADFDGVPWYEEYPTRPGSHVLNGYLYSLLGLYDIAPWSPVAGRLFRRGVAALRARIGRFDRPGGSYYLPGLPASGYYNRVHVDLLGAIDYLRPSPRLQRFRGRWWVWTVASYSPTRRCVKVCSIPRSR
jgi:heparosan-N-sulfate-glucuronate 5-epimerase